MLRSRGNHAQSSLPAASARVPAKALTGEFSLKKLIWIGAMTLMLAGTPASAGPLCDKATAAVPEAGHCADTDRGVALAASPERASALLAYVVAAEASFALHFKHEVPTYAILESDDPSTTSPALASLHRDGFATILPWISRGGLRAASDAKVRHAIEESGMANGWPKTQVEATIQTVLATQRANLEDASLDRTEALTLPHELGHLWYINAYWPNSEAGAKHYGGPAWDWMDETAAILMEDSSDPGKRRAMFKAVYSGATSDIASGVSPSGILDLERFLTRQHPGLDQAPTASAGQGAGSAANGPTIQLSIKGSGNALPSALSKAQALMAYYAQARLFADFMLERSGDPAIYDSITVGMKSGQTFEGWLRSKGKSFNLPVTQSALGSEWRGWLMARFGPPGPATAGTASGETVVGGRGANRHSQARPR